MNIKKVKCWANANLCIKASIRGCSPSVPITLTPSCLLWPISKEAKNKWTSMGPRKTGVWPLLRVSSKRCLYVIGVTSKSPKENVGSTASIPKSREEVQKHCRSANCWLWCCFDIANKLVHRVLSIRTLHYNKEFISYTVNRPLLWSSFHVTNLFFIPWQLTRCSSSQDSTYLSGYVFYKPLFELSSLILTMVLGHMGENGFFSLEFPCKERRRLKPWGNWYTRRHRWWGLLEESVIYHRYYYIIFKFCVQRPGKTPCYQNWPPHHAL